MMQGFNVQQKDEWLFYPQTLGWENYRVVSEGQTLKGGLAILATEQYWGGNRIPLGAIASVSVLPEYRGQGVAKTLLTEMLRELYTRKIPLSALYAATQYLYRQVGYEQGGNNCWWRVPIETIPSGDRTLPLTRVSLDADYFASLHSNWAKHHQGSLNRNEIFWKLRLCIPQETVFAYVVGNPGQPEGYIIFTQQDQQLAIRDWVGLTPAANQRLWTFLADHRSQINLISWRGAISDPRLILLPEQTAQVVELERWMLRIVDVQSAFKLRGYPPDLDTELHLAIQDSIIPENQGQFILRVKAGQGQIEQGGTGAMQLDIKALAALYTGLYSAWQLQQTGQLIATEPAIAIATQLFSSTEPWMSDKF